MKVRKNDVGFAIYILTYASSCTVHFKLKNKQCIMKYLFNVSHKYCVILMESHDEVYLSANLTIKFEIENETCWLSFFFQYDSKI